MSCDTSWSRTGGSSWPTSRFNVSAQDHSTTQTRGVKTLRGLEKTTRKVACWKNHRHFNTRCLHDNVIPKSLHLRSTVKGIKASTILRKAEKKQNFSVPFYGEQITRLKRITRSEPTYETSRNGNGGSDSVHRACTLQT